MLRTALNIIVNTDADTYIGSDSAMLVMHMFIPASVGVCTYSLSARTGFNPILDTSRYSFLIYITLLAIIL
jgi:putative effector of murein hydrolase LrgA (UPF0299 family)